MLVSLKSKWQEVGDMTIANLACHFHFTWQFNMCKITEKRLKQFWTKRTKWQSLTTYAYIDINVHVCRVVLGITASLCKELLLRNNELNKIKFKKHLQSIMSMGEQC